MGPLRIRGKLVFALATGNKHPEGGGDVIDESTGVTEGRELGASSRLGFWKENALHLCSGIGWGRGYTERNLPACRHLAEGAWNSAVSGKMRPRGFHMPFGDGGRCGQKLR